MLQPGISEHVRLERLIERDGREASHQWTKRTAALYRQCVSDPAHYASQADKKPLFEASISQLEHFADTGLVPYER